MESGFYPVREKKEGSSFGLGYSIERFFAHVLRLGGIGNRAMRTGI